MNQHFLRQELYRWVLAFMAKSAWKNRCHGFSNPFVDVLKTVPRRIFDIFQHNKAGGNVYTSHSSPSGDEALAVKKLIVPIR